MVLSAIARLAGPCGTPIRKLITSTYLYGKLRLKSFNASCPDGYIKKALTDGNIQESSTQQERQRCRPALPIRESYPQLAERVRELLFLFRLSFSIQFNTECNKVLSLHRVKAKTRAFSEHTSNAIFIFFRPKSQRCGPSNR